jgi:hypothetical protein
MPDSIVVNMQFFSGCKVPLPQWRLILGPNPTVLHVEQASAHFFGYTRDEDGRLIGGEIIQMRCGIAYGQKIRRIHHAQQRCATFDGIPDWELPLFSADSGIAHRYNPRPEQKLAHQTEDARPEDQLPSARTNPEPHHLLMSLDSSQQVIGENEETQQRRQLVTERAIVLADRDFFSCRAVVGEKEPHESDRYVQSVVAQNHPQR